MRARTFLLFWLGGTLGVLAYAALDLTMNPGLTVEVSMSMKPDLSRLPDLAHWGGRLLHHDMIPLLVTNAILIGGLVALVGAWVVGKFRPEPKVETVTAYDSVPPPTMRSPYSR